MKKIAIATLLIAAGYADMVAYPQEALAKLIKEQPALITDGMKRAIAAAKGKYIAGFIIRFDDNGDILIKAITIKKGGGI